MAVPVESEFGLDALVELTGHADEFLEVLDATLRLDRVLGVEFGEEVGGIDRVALRPVAPQLPQGEEDDDDPDRIDLAPDDAVEPGDREEEEEAGGEEGATPGRSQLLRHRADQPGDPEVGEDRGDLDQVADPADEPPDRADQPEQVEVARRVVGEEAALVEAEGPLCGEVLRPLSEGGEIDPEPGARESVYDDDPEDEPEREERGESDERTRWIRRSARGSRALFGIARGGACHQVGLLLSAEVS